MADTLTLASPDDSNPTEILTDQKSGNGLQRPSGPQRLTEFFHDVREEMKKVVTPARAEVQSTTIIVLATVFIFAAYFELVDIVLGKGIDKLLLSLTKH